MLETFFQQITDLPAVCPDLLECVTSMLKAEQSGPRAPQDISYAHEDGLNNVLDLAFLTIARSFRNIFVLYFIM